MDYGCRRQPCSQAPAISQMLIAGSSLPGPRHPCRHRCGLRQCEYRRADGNRTEGIGVLNHTITPETEKSCHYFWHHARNYRLDDPDLTEFLAKAASTAFGEDVDILAAQQRSIDSARQNGGASISTMPVSCRHDGL